MYLSAAPDIFERMQNDIDTKNWSNLAINAHSLKPQVDFMGIAALKELLVKIEEGVKAGETESLAALHNKAYQMHQEAEPILRDAIGDG